MIKSEGYDAYVSKGNSDLGLVVVHEIFGFNNYVKSVTDALSSAGHSAAAVDFFKGKRARTLEEGVVIRDALRREEIYGAIRAGFQVLKASGAKKFGILGFCMGGRFALLGACNLPEASFCVDFYGMIDNVQEVVNLGGPVLLILASEDTRITSWAHTSFLPAAVKYKKRVEVHLYPNVNHAFHNSAGANYNEEAAKDAWARTVEFLSRMK